MVIYDTKAISELISESWTQSSQPSRDHIRQVLQQWSERLTQGSVRPFAKLLGIPHRSMFEWLSGESIPTLGSLLSMCNTVGVPLTSVLSGSECEYTPMIVRHQPPRRTGKGKKPRVFNALQVQLALRDALLSSPPPAMKRVAKQIGFHPALLYRHFPADCRSIGRRYLEYQRLQRKNRISALCEEVRGIVRAAVAEGKPPTVRIVHSKRPGCLADPEVYRAWREIVDELVGANS